MEALSASSSMRSMGSSMLATPPWALCSRSHSIRFLRVLLFFFITNTAGSPRFWRGIPTPVAVALLKSRDGVGEGDVGRLVWSNLTDPQVHVMLVCSAAERTVPAYKALVDSPLCLASQVVVDTRDDDYQLVPGVRGLAD